MNDIFWLEFKTKNFVIIFIIQEVGQLLCFTYPTQFICFPRIDNGGDDNDDEEDGADEDRGDDVASDADAVITANRITNWDVCFLPTKKLGLFTVFTRHMNETTHQ